MKSKGFTLVELMITMAVMAVTLSIAVPLLSNMMQNNLITSNTNSIIGAFNYARIEAVKRGVNITIASSDTSASGNSWGSGYRVWIDDGNTVGTFETGEEELRVFDALPTSLTLNSTPVFYTFRATGFAVASDSLTLCTDESGVQGRQLLLSLSGRLQASNITCP